MLTNSQKRNEGGSYNISKNFNEISMHKLRKITIRASWSQNGAQMNCVVKSKA
jgi:hypothetical protein